MSTASTVPDALDALIACANTAAAAVKASIGEDVQVVDGGAKLNNRTRLIVGYAAGAAGDAVEDTQSNAGLGVARDMESYAVACQVETFVNNGKFTDLRRAAYAVLDAFHDAIVADKTLGHVVMSARIAEVGYVPTIPQGSGPTVTLPFRVQIEARRKAAA